MTKNWGRNPNPEKPKSKLGHANCSVCGKTYSLREGKIATHSFGPFRQVCAGSGKAPA